MVVGHPEKFFYCLCVAGPRNLDFFDNYSGSFFRFVCVGNVWYGFTYFWMVLWLLSLQRSSLISGFDGDSYINIKHISIILLMLSSIAGCSDYGCYF